MAIANNNDANASGDLLFSIPVSGRDGTTFINAGEIRCYVDAAVSTGKVPTRFELWTTNSSGTLTKGWTLDSAQALTLVGNLTAPALLKLSGIETGLTAFAGGGQGSALALSASKSIHNVTTVGTAADSVKLPAATGSGAVHWVKNSAAANSLQLFAASTETIDGVASATGVAIAAGKSRICLDFAAGTWLSILGA